MKKAFLFLSAIALSVCLFAQAKKAEDVVKFKEVSWDFGKIKQGTPVTHNFDFSNTSNAPIVIESAIASCGCTTPVKPEAPIAKGQSNIIKAGFNAMAAGPFNKTITVKVAGIDLPLQLRITGEVLSADAFAKYQTEKDNSSKPIKTASK
ncbi:MAG: DUF1573 domain-containing protein [Bacteroidetes bacterium]|nr:DUF1573 domain-containing protein [Bacteroidota bacterium]